MLARQLLSIGRGVARHPKARLTPAGNTFHKRFHSDTSSNHIQSSSGKKAALVAGLLLAGATLYTINDHKVSAAGPSKQQDDKQDQLSTFNKYSSIEKAGKRYMTPDDFFRAIITTADEEEQRGMLDEAKFRVLFHMADSDNSGLISFEEYVHFQTIINKPDADYMLAFKIFDRDGNGKISKEDFKQVVAANFMNSKIPFDFECELVRMYFGKGENELSYNQFTQLLKDLQQERVKQEFRYYDTKGTGYIPVDKFSQVIAGIKLRRIPEYILSNIKSVANLNEKTKHEGEVSFAQFMATNDLLLHIPSYGRVLRAASNRSGKKEITKEEFIDEAHRSTTIEITPMEVDIIYSLFDSNRDGRLSLNDFNVVTTPAAPAVAPVRIGGKTFAERLLESIENFALGAVAGGIGATAVYPIDLVKTRMQNQRAVDPAQRVYKNSWDCFMKVLRNEGFVGLYKGLVPQIVGVAPEKAIKLTVNDLLRGLFEDKSKGEIYFPLEVLAGGGAGASQVLFTNPLEIVKIRLQVQGEGGKGPKVGALHIIRELGFAGLYKGAGACLLRDIPFSAIYFPTYAKMKELLKDSDGNLGPKDLLIAGAVAGIPAASLVTPADVIKTRLQVKARTGEQTYTGIRDCFWKVLTQEGPKAFFKGCLARVFRSSPQFGVTLLSYEMLQKWFAPHVTPRPPTNVPVSQKDFESLQAAPVRKVLQMEKKFGNIGITPENKEDEK